MTSFHAVVAYIQSPRVGQISLGPLNLRLYGLMVALGVVAAIYLAGWLLRTRGISSELAIHVAVLGVPLGLIGARAYHVITDWKLYQGRAVDIFKIWEGGLGIPGAIVGGVLGGLLVVRIRKLEVRPLLDAAAAGIPLGQAIGRLGNYFNQELFGRPTELPWGLRIDEVNRPPEYVEFETFHPTFLYESLWNVGVCLLAIWAFRRMWLPSGHLFALYVALYSGGRLWVEALRSDPASLVLGVRINIWVMGFVLIAAAAFLLTVTRKAHKTAALGEEAEEPPEPDAVSAPDAASAATVESVEDAEVESVEDAEVESVEDAEATSVEDAVATSVESVESAASPASAASAEVPSAESVEPPAESAEFDEASSVQKEASEASQEIVEASERSQEIVEAPAEEEVPLSGEEVPREG